MVGTQVRVCAQVMAGLPLLSVLFLFPNTRNINPSKKKKSPSCEKGCSEGGSPPTFYSSLTHASLPRQGSHFYQFLVYLVCLFEKNWATTSTHLTQKVSHNCLHCLKSTWHTVSSLRPSSISAISRTRERELVNKNVLVEPFITRPKPVLRSWELLEKMGVRTSP